MPSKVLLREPPAELWEYTQTRVHKLATFAARPNPQAEQEHTGVTLVHTRAHHVSDGDSAPGRRQSNHAQSASSHRFKVPSPVHDDVSATASRCGD